MSFIALFIATALAQSGPEETVRITVAAVDLPPGTVIALEDLATKRLSPDYVPDAVVRDPNALVGRIVREAILSQEFIREERLAAPESGRNIGALVPRGMRIVQLPLRKPMPWPEPTDRIDVAYVLDGALCVALQAVPVLYTESRPERFLSYAGPDHMAASLLVAVDPTQVGQLLREEDPVVLLRGPTDLARSEALPPCPLP